MVLVCMLVYVDSCVFLNYWLDESGKHLDQIFSYRAKEFFDKVLSCDYEVLISNVVVKEVSKPLGFSERECWKFFEESPLAKKLKFHLVSKENVKFAHMLQNKFGLHYSDAMHASIAKKYGIPVVTRNIKDFEKVKSVV